MRIKCDSIGIATEDYNPGQIVKSRDLLYTGFEEYLVDDQTIDRFYRNDEIFADKKEIIDVWGDGNQTRDFIHVYDLVDAIIKATQKGKSAEVYNVGSGKETSVNLIVKIIGGKKIRVPKRPGEPDRSKADITKIKKQFNWKPKISIKEGVEMLLKDISNWKDAPIWTPEKIKKATKSWFQLLGKS